jgi:hypothetical protein
MSHMDILFFILPQTAQGGEKWIREDAAGSARA